MSSFLEWYSRHNTIIIQILFGLIGLFIVVQLFRLFFGAKESEDTGSNKSTSAVEEKLNKIIENQSKTFGPLSGSAGSSGLSTTKTDFSQSDNSSSVATDGITGGAGTASGQSQNIQSAAAQAQSAEIEKLRLEITQLQTSIQEKDQIISQTAVQQTAQQSLSPQNTDSLNTVQQATAVRGDTDSAALISQYKKEIEDLKNKLSDFDVIAADIAELPRLREEVKRYQGQLGAVPTAAPAKASSTASEVGSSELESGALDSVLADISEGLGVASETAAETALVQEPVTDQEKELINEFEKNKG